MRKLILTGMAVAMLAIPSIASADVTNNKSVKDAQGYCISNHIHNGWSEDNPFNGTENGIGHLRSQQTGADISGSAGNRVPASPCIDAQGVWGPISS
jgi:hypothetical protein